MGVEWRQVRMDSVILIKFSFFGGGGAMLRPPHSPSFIVYTLKFTILLATIRRFSVVSLHVFSESLSPEQVLDPRNIFSLSKGKHGLLFSLGSSAA